MMKNCNDIISNELKLWEIKLSIDIEKKILPSCLERVCSFIFFYCPKSTHKLYSFADMYIKIRDLYEIINNKIQKNI